MSDALLPALSNRSDQVALRFGPPALAPVER